MLGFFFFGCCYYSWNFLKRQIIRLSTETGGTPKHKSPPLPESLLYTTSVLQKTCISTLFLLTEGNPKRIFTFTKIVVTVLMYVFPVFWEWDIFSALCHFQKERFHSSALLLNSGGNLISFRSWLTWTLCLLQSHHILCICSGVPRSLLNSFSSR